MHCWAFVWNKNPTSLRPLQRNGLPCSSSHRQPNPSPKPIRSPAVRIQKREHVNWPMRTNWQSVWECNVMHSWFTPKQSSRAQVRVKICLHLSPSPFFFHAWCSLDCRRRKKEGEWEWSCLAIYSPKNRTVETMKEHVARSFRALTIATTNPNEGAVMGLVLTQINLRYSTQQLCPYNLLFYCK